MTYDNNQTITLTIQNLIAKSNLTDAIFLFEFIDTINNKKSLVLSDVSTNPNQYSSFELELVDSINLEDLNDSKIYLQSGEYILNIYQTVDGTIGTKQIAFGGQDYIHTSSLKLKEDVLQVKYDVPQRVTEKYSL